MIWVAKQLNYKSEVLKSGSQQFYNLVWHPARINGPRSEAALLGCSYKDLF